MRTRFSRPFDSVAQHTLAPRARHMRLTAPTLSEAILWRGLRRDALGVRFRRQVILGALIVDFFAPSRGLVVEVDGPIHQYRRDVDRIRDAALGDRGLRVVRVDADLVECDLDGALAVVRHALVAA